MAGFLMPFRERYYRAQRRHKPTKGRTAINLENDPAQALGPFLSLVIADDALAARLAAEQDAAAFIALACKVAAARGITLDPHTISGLAEPDPLGLSRWTARAVHGSAWPPPRWLPIQVAQQGEQIVVDWAYFGTAPLTESFFEDSVRKALRLPFNRLFRYRTRLDDFVAGASAADSLEPDGFIFHMSRCGSTLAAQMLAALPQITVISEAAPIDAAVQISRLWPHVPDDRHMQILRAMIAAFGRRRNGERHFVIKLDAWHTLALPLFRRAFPATPWMFLYRDPVEVLVSQLRQRGMQTVPDLFAPGFYGIGDIDGMPAEEYCARVFSRICSAAADHADSGMFIDYRDLPRAVATRVLPLLGLSPDDDARAAMAAVALRDAKAPYRPFTADGADKQRMASAAVRAAAAQHFGQIYRRLTELSTAAPIYDNGMNDLGQ